MKRETILKKIEREFDATIPIPIRSIIIELDSNPLWRKIGETLHDVPPGENVGTLRLMNLMRKYIQQKGLDPLLEIQRSVEELEKRKYLVVERKSLPNYFLTPAFVEAIRVARLLDEKVIEPIVKELRNDPELREIENLEQTIKQEIYNALGK